MVPKLIAGHIYGVDGNPIENALVYVFNKNLDETHNGAQAEFPELKTNSAGEYQVNLANFSGEYTLGDRIYVSARYRDRAGMVTFLLAESVYDKDITVRDLEPAIAVSKLLQMKLSDPNEGNRVSDVKWIRPKYQRDDMVINDYPVITVNDRNEEAEGAGISNTNKAEKRVIDLRIKLYVWSKKPEQKFTIAGVVYEGTKLRDYMARKVSNVLKEFLIRPQYDQNGIVNKFYDYKRLRMESPDFREEPEQGVMTKEIDIQLSNVTQE